MSTPSSVLMDAEAANALGIVDHVHDKRERAESDGIRTVRGADPTAVYRVTTALSVSTRVAIDPRQPMVTEVGPFRGVMSNDLAFRS